MTTVWVDPYEADLAAVLDIADADTRSAALDVLAKLARPHLIASVPREPLWRILNVARGRYWSELGNTPGHLQHWSRTTFIALLQQRFEVIEVRNPLPWTMALCRARAR